METQLLKEIVLEQHDIFRKTLEKLVSRTLLPSIKPFISMPHSIVLSGLRRSGKSTLLKEIANQYYKDSDFYYLSFEDERLLNFKARDFNKLYSVFVELFGERTIFFFDEIQVVDHWEAFVRRKMDQGAKFFLTGSNASLLSREIGSKLTGRHQRLELYPYSFREYLQFQDISVQNNDLLVTEKRAQIAKYLQTYIESGGLPEYVTYQQIQILRDLYNDILYRDIALRHDIKDMRTLREISLYLLSHIGRRLSFNKLKEYFHLGSVNTIIKYIGFLEDAYLLFQVNQYSPSLKKQQIASKKIYAIDNGLCRSISFEFSNNRGWYLENMVAIELKRRGKEIFTYETTNGKEIDFLVREGSKITQLIQVTRSVSDFEVKEREVSALTKGMDELGIQDGLILTESEDDEIKIKNKGIQVQPLYRWLLS